MPGASLLVQLLCCSWLPALTVNGSSIFAAGKISYFLSFPEALNNIMAAVPPPMPVGASLLYNIRSRESLSSNRNLCLLWLMMLLLASIFSADMRLEEPHQASEQSNPTTLDLDLS